eukprot:CAMPEP_0185477212 /NCGR_PEP_ID=MMETSP1366-20130426/3842_1 /TAXON_ID=38817 /ORGANISM="Gephyrocapsa oceanica, Strain RCC1303" /LENGTH=719 /DNA_ID=CAMNT_0028084331 /DNA_START=109 /DNA_END=2266 /DNA_ORIENTATION=-
MGPKEPTVLVPPATCSTGDAGRCGWVGVEALAQVGVDLATTLAATRPVEGRRSPDIGDPARRKGEREAAQDGGRVRLEVADGVCLQEVEEDEHVARHLCPRVHAAAERDDARCEGGAKAVRGGCEGLREGCEGAARGLRGGCEGWRGRQGGSRAAVQLSVVDSVGDDGGAEPVAEGARSGAVVVSVEDPPLAAARLQVEARLAGGMARRVRRRVVAPGVRLHLDEAPVEAAVGDARERRACVLPVGRGCAQHERHLIEQELRHPRRRQLRALEARHARAPLARREPEVPRGGGGRVACAAVEGRGGVQRARRGEQRGAPLDGGEGFVARLGLSPQIDNGGSSTSHSSDAHTRERGSSPTSAARREKPDRPKSKRPERTIALARTSWSLEGARAQRVHGRRVAHRERKAEAARRRPRRLARCVGARGEEEAEAARRSQPPRRRVPALEHALHVLLHRGLHRVGRPAGPPRVGKARVHRQVGVGGVGGVGGVRAERGKQPLGGPEEEVERAARRVLGLHLRQLCPREGVDVGPDLRHLAAAHLGRAPELARRMEVGLDDDALRVEIAADHTLDATEGRHKPMALRTAAQGGEERRRQPHVDVVRVEKVEHVQIVPIPTDEEGALAHHRKVQRRREPVRHVGEPPAAAMGVAALVDKRPHGLARVQAGTQAAMMLGVALPGRGVVGGCPRETAHLPAPAAEHTPSRRAALHSAAACSSPPPP